jgi:hypothetical protein
VEQLWIARAALHGIHSIFPAPDITQHIGGRDSISLKKLQNNDGMFLTSKIILGFLFQGSNRSNRLVALPKEKAESYVRHIRDALDRQQHYISKSDFQKLHGRLVHASLVMPCMSGFMSELNRTLAAASITVGLGKTSRLREILEEFAFFLNQAHSNPSHITELVGPNLPHIYGYTDASRTGMGGVILPATKWIPPLVWRLQLPADIISLFERGDLSINDLELAANFVAERIGETHMASELKGLNSWFGSDNTATVSWKTKRAAHSKAGSYFAPQALRAEALLQRHTRRGPQDSVHIEGVSNLLGDFPSRSYDQGFENGREGDTNFLTEFSHRHPLPPQLAHWQLVRPTNEITSLVCSMLRGPALTSDRMKTDTGEAGPPLLFPLGSTLSSQTHSAKPTIWNELCCSWPLLSPCGKVDSTTRDKLEAQRSRGRYANARSSWSPSTETRSLVQQYVSSIHSNANRSTDSWRSTTHGQCLPAFPHRSLI